MLDEPTVGVDKRHVRSFYEMLEQLNREWGITLILVTHDIGAVSDKVTHVACLNQHLYFHGDIHAFQQLDKEKRSSWYAHDVRLLAHEHG